MVLAGKSGRILGLGEIRIVHGFKHPKHVISWPIQPLESSHWDPFPNETILHKCVQRKRNDVGRRLPMDLDGLSDRRRPAGNPVPRWSKPIL